MTLHFRDIIVLLVIIIPLSIMMTLWATSHISNVLREISVRYRALYREMHNEMIEIVRTENDKVVRDARALILEHTELDALVKELARQHGTQEAMHALKKHAEEARNTLHPDTDDDNEEEDHHVP